MFDISFHACFSHQIRIKAFFNHVLSGVPSFFPPCILFHFSWGHWLARECRGEQVNPVKVQHDWEHQKHQLLFCGDMECLVWESLRSRDSSKLQDGAFRGRVVGGELDDHCDWSRSLSLPVSHVSGFWLRNLRWWSDKVCTPELCEKDDERYLRGFIYLSTQDRDFVTRSTTLICFLSFFCDLFFLSGWRERGLCSSFHTLTKSKSNPEGFWATSSHRFMQFMQVFPTIYFQCH